MQTVYGVGELSLWECLRVWLGLIHPNLELAGACGRFTRNFRIQELHYVEYEAPLHSHRGDLLVHFRFRALEGFV